MKIDIKSEYGHYVMYVDGKFYGTYDSVKEAADDIEEIRNKKEDGAA